MKTVLVEKRLFFFHPRIHYHHYVNHDVMNNSNLTGIINDLTHGRFYTPYKGN